VNSTFKIGTRGSPLALYQANSVAGLLHVRAGVESEIVIIKTSGDRLSESSLSEVGGKRLFVKEIEDALLAGEIDLAVHSSKDMPALLPEGLTIGSVLSREDPRDAFVMPDSQADLDLDAIRQRLGSAPRIGTSSVRRIAQLIGFSPSATFLPIRGNLDTRLRKLDSGGYDALVLAAAGLRRLRHAARISALIPVDVCVPAPGQGIIAVEIRQDDQRAAQVVAVFNDADAAIALRAERAVVDRLGGGCQMPIGAYAHAVTDGMLALTGIVVSTDGSTSVRTEVQGSIHEPEELGRRTADELLTRGADRILAEARRALSATESHHP
jgi:hydroxymethylbilane synthase